MAIWQPQDLKVRLFGVDGIEKGSFGRAGEGPGEFRSVGAHGWVGDSLWILDGKLHRTSVFTARGVLVRDGIWLNVLTLPSPSYLKFSGGPIGAAPGAILPDGSFVPMSGVHLPERNGADGTIGVSARESIVRVGPDGVLRKVLLTTPPLGRPPACFREWESGTISGSIGAPFCASPIKAFSPDGSTILVLQQANAQGAKGSFNLLLLSTRGDTLLRREIPYSPEKIAASALEAEFAKSTPRGMRLAQMPRAYLDAKKQLPRIIYYPPVRRILLGRDEATWIELDGASPSHRWLVLNARSGAVIGVLQLPPNITLRAVSRDTVWASELDEDDVPSVVRLKILGP
ncbi:MAG: hypothetical protein ABIZ70_10910 [Gemmatimonadales bacterium]